MGNEPVILLDTDALVWWLTQAPELSTAAQRAIGRHAAASSVVASTISVLEFATAVCRGRLAFWMPVEQWLAEMRSIPESRLEPGSADIAAFVTTDDKLRSNPALKTIW
jgi:PIN domain nuclease of toxin-antitoxin system